MMRPTLLSSGFKPELPALYQLYTLDHDKFKERSNPRKNFCAPEIISKAIESMTRSRRNTKVVEHPWVNISAAFVGSIVGDMPTTTVQPPTILSPISTGAEQNTVKCPISITGYAHFPKFPEEDNDDFFRITNKGEAAWPRCDIPAATASDRSRETGKLSFDLLPSLADILQISDISGYGTDFCSPSESVNLDTAEEAEQFPTDEFKPAFTGFRAILQCAFEEDERRAAIAGESPIDTIVEEETPETNTNPFPPTAHIRQKAKALLREFEEYPLPDIEELMGAYV